MRNPLKDTFLIVVKTKKEMGEAIKRERAQTPLLVCGVFHFSR